MATIKLTNNVKISSDSLVAFIDTTNVIADLAINSSPRQYVATADCWVFCSTNSSDSSGRWLIDGVETEQRGFNQQLEVRTFLLLKGQILTYSTSSVNLYVRAFGLK